MQHAVSQGPENCFPPLNPLFKEFKASALILVVVLVWFSPWWIGGKNLAPLDLLNGMMSPWRQGEETRYAKNHIVSDAVDQYLVYRMVAANSYAKEGWVGWSSLTYGGTAQYANTMALYYDWTMQLHRWFDFWTAWNLGLMAQILLAAFGMHAFLRARDINPLWSCCGALAYAANSQFITWINHRWALSTFCWVPWILLAIQLHRKGSRAAGFAVPILLGMSFLGGTLQHAAIVVLVIIAMWAEEVVQLRTSVDSVPTKRPHAHLLVRYSVWGIGGACLAAMMFLPCADAFFTSNRLGLHTGMTTNVANSVYPQGWLQPLFNLAAYPLQVFPSLLGRCDSIDLLKLFKTELFYVCYFGSLPVIIGFTALWRTNSPTFGRILIWAGLLLPLTPLVRLLYQRLLVLFVIGAILAFTHYMQNAKREERLKLFRFLSIAVSLSVASWTALSVVLLTQPVRLAMLRDRIAEMGGGSSFGYFKTWLQIRADHFISDLFIWSPQQITPLFLLLVALAGLRFTASTRDGLRKAGSWLVTIAVIGEVSVFASRWVVWTDPNEHPLFPTTAESRILQEKVGHDGRVTTVIHPTAHMAFTPFVPNTLSPYGIATISGYDSIIPNGMILPTETPEDAMKLGRCGVTHLITWAGNLDIPSDWKPIWSSRSMDLYENPFAVPRYGGLAETWEKSSFLANKKVAWINLNESSGLENSRLLEMPAGVQWLRIAENHAPGWEYRPVGNPTWQAVGTAEDKAMWLENPTPGQAKRIEMRYRPPLRAAGFAISGATLALLALSAVLSTFCRKPAAAEQKTSLPSDSTLP